MAGETAVRLVPCRQSLTNDDRRGPLNEPNVHTRTSVPAHIRPDSVVDYDFYNDRRHGEVGDIHLALHRMSEEECRGIFWTPQNGGHWIINDYELLFEAARDPVLFSSMALTLPPMPKELEPRVIPVGLDPPVHGPYRMPLMRGFAPDRIRALEGDIRAFAGELIDRVAAQGECDFVDAIAEPMPVIIFMKMMGMDISRLREFRTWVYDMLSNSDERRVRSHHNVADMMAELIAAREQKPEQDLISELVYSEVNGRRVTTDEVQAYCLLLFGAGLDTVANSLSFSMNYLTGDPALQDRLRADPTLIGEAVEEFLRKFGIANVVRVVTRDAEFGGVQLKAGERVLLMLSAGNYDPKIFPEPERFDLDRDNKTHISFNTGPHRCVGSHLARIEMKVFYEEWFRRMPMVRRDPDKRVSLRGGQTLALGNLPLLWDPAQLRPARDQHRGVDARP
jgi:cytochrome P450